MQQTVTAERPTKEEIEEVIKKLPRRKASGPDELTAEVLQAAGEIGVEMTEKLIGNIW